jgi:type VI protein secretion system component VasK
MVDQFVARVPAEPQAGSTVQFGAAEPGRTVAVPAAARLGAAAAAREPVALTARDSGEQLERLQYLCRLIRRCRQPVCGLNGVLTLLPVDVLQVPPGEAEEVARALKGDLSTIHDTLQLRTPTIATVAGLEEDRGFRELIRRVGRERAAAQRFGQKFELRRYATQEDMEALSAHVCGTFEDWIYALFREPDALNRPGNTQLYRLLCTVRCHWKTRLANLLSHGCGYDPQRQPDDERCFVSGCYCAATGESSDRQAFVKAVIDKLVEENELVEWTERAWREQRRYRRAAAVGYTLAAVLAGLTVVAVVYQQLS